MFTLIRPPAVECFRLATTSITPPLGLAYIAGALRSEDVPVQVLDGVLEAPSQFTPYYKGYLVGLTLDEIVARLAPSEMIGISALFTHEWPFVAELTQRIKARFPHTPLVLGGEHVTSLPEFSLATSEADVLVLGEGEETILELWNARHTPQSWGKIAGTAVREVSGGVHTSRRPRKLVLDQIPPPAWENFDLRGYHRHGFSGGIDTGHLTVPILATRGCPYRCTYCSAPNMWTTRWLARDPIAVVDEIEGYQRKFGAQNFPFQDLTAILKKDWIVTFCEELLRRDLNITWQFPTGTRCEVIDQEVARLMKRSGMIGMSYAPESGSETTRKVIRKQMRTAPLEKSISAASKEGLYVTLFLVLGFPHDRSQSIRENIPFLRRVRELGVRDISIGYYMALPGTELFHSLRRSGKIQLNRAYFQHILHGLTFVPLVSYCSHLGRLKLMYWKLRLYGAFYLSGRLIRLFGSLLNGLSGLTTQGHQTKLQTAVRNAFRAGVCTFLSLRRPHWVPRQREQQLFDSWERRPPTDSPRPLASARTPT